MTEGKPGNRSPPVACHDVPHGLSVVATPEAKVVHRELAGGGEGPGGRAIQGEGGRDLPGSDHPGQGRPGRSPEEIASVTSCVGWKNMRMMTRHCRPYPS